MTDYDRILGYCVGCEQPLPADERHYCAVCYADSNAALVHISQQAVKHVGMQIEAYCQARLRDLSGPRHSPQTHEQTKDGQWVGIREVMLFSARLTGLDGDDGADRKRPRHARTMKP